jgi:hypothetical protein
MLFISLQLNLALLKSKEKWFFFESDFPGLNLTNGIVFNAIRSIYQDLVHYM